jgi:hypothetical protein
VSKPEKIIKRFNHHSIMVMETAELTSSLGTEEIAQVNYQAVQPSLHHGDGDS